VHLVALALKIWLSPRIENNAPTPPEKAPLIQGTPPRIDGYFYAIYRAAKNHGRASIKSGT
jgi:hypothetical protein